ncbi:MAG: cation:proton antiporter [Flavobacterium sp.]
MEKYFAHFIHEFKTPLDNPVLIFSLILFIILLSPILLRKIKIPGIIGLIISGVVIGPFGLNILEQNSAIDLFSTIGLLYIMFIAGLELDLQEFKAHKNKSLIFGFLTFIIPLSIGFPVCYYLLDYNAMASILTASMFATHTLVAYPIVSSMGISKNPAVAVTVGGTILTDTAVLIILAVVMGSSQGSLDQDFWIRLVLSLAAFTAIMFLIIPRIAKWFFQKLESEKHAHYIFVLSVVFFAAFLAEAAGVEPIIGAFFAGLALNPLIPNSSALMNRIEFLGNSLFIPFFLISVGMLVNTQVIFSGPSALIIAGTLTVVAISAKWFAAYFTQLIFKFSGPQRQLIFGLSSAHAAATLAVILVGYKAQILDENILNGTIILILITCIVASFATEKAAKNIIISDETENEDLEQLGSSANEHILIPFVDIENVHKLLEFATMIKDKKSSKPITMLSIVPNNEEAEINIAKSRKKLDEYVLQAAASEVKVNTMVTIDHNPASGIVRTAKELAADIIIIGWPQKVGFIDKIFGDKATSIISNTHKMLFISRFQKPVAFNNKLIMISPELTEREVGFEQLIQKIARIAQEFNMPIISYSDERTNDALNKLLVDKKISIRPIFKRFTDWEKFSKLSEEITEKDLIIFNSARHGSISYEPVLDRIPYKLEKYFKNNNLLVTYAQQSKTLEKHKELPPEPLTIGLEAIEQMGKGIGSIFRKK